MGLSPNLTTSEQGAQVGRYWEQRPEPRPAFSLEIVRGIFLKGVGVGVLWPQMACLAVYGETVPIPGAGIRYNRNSEDRRLSHPGRLLCPGRGRPDDTGLGG